MSYCHTWHLKENSEGKKYDATPYIQYILLKARSDAERCKILAGSLYHAYFLEGKPSTEDLEDIVKSGDTYDSVDFRNNVFNLLSCYSQRVKANKDVVCGSLGKVLENIIKHITPHVNLGSPGRDAIIALFLQDIQKSEFSCYAICKQAIENNISSNGQSVINYFITFFNKDCEKKEAHTVLDTSIHDAINRNRPNSLVALMKLLQDPTLGIDRDAVYKSALNALVNSSNLSILNIIYKHLPEDTFKLKLQIHACEAAVGNDKVQCFEQMLQKITNNERKLCTLQNMLVSSVGFHRVCIILIVLDVMMKNYDPNQYQGTIETNYKTVTVLDINNVSIHKPELDAIKFILKAAKLQTAKLQTANYQYNLLSNALKAAGKEKNFSCMIVLIKCANNLQSVTSSNRQNLLQDTLTAAMRDSTVDKNYKDEIAAMLDDVSKLSKFKFIDKPADMSKMWGSVVNDINKATPDIADIDNIVNIYEKVMQKYTVTSKIPPKEGFRSPARSPSRRLRSASKSPSRASTHAGKMVDCESSPAPSSDMPSRKPPKKIDFAQNDDGSKLNETYTVDDGSSKLNEVSGCPASHTSSPARTPRPSRLPISTIPCERRNNESVTRSTRSHSRTRGVIHASPPPKTPVNSDTSVNKVSNTRYHK